MSNSSLNYLENNSKTFCINFDRQKFDKKEVVDKIFSNTKNIKKFMNNSKDFSDYEVYNFLDYMYNTELIEAIENDDVFRIVNIIDKKVLGPIMQKNENDGPQPRMLVWAVAAGVVGLLEVALYSGIVVVTRSYVTSKMENKYVNKLLSSTLNEEIAAIMTIVVKYGGEKLANAVDTQLFNKIKEYSACSVDEALLNA